MQTYRLILLAMAVLMLAGCVEMRVDGDAKIFQSSAVGFILRVVLGIGLMILGVVSFIGSFLPDRKPRNQYEAMEPGVSNSQRIAVALFGCAMGFTGLCLVGFSLVFINKLHVTVYPDRVAMAGTYNQTGGREVIIPFANLRSVELRDDQNIVGKRRTYLVFTLNDGSTVQQLAGNNERQAVDTIQQSLADYKLHPKAVAGNANNAANDLKVIDGSGFFPAAGALASSAPEDSNSTAAQARPAANKKVELRRYPVTVPVPSDYSTVGPETIVRAGTKLKACFFGKWSSVTVLAVNDDGTLTCDMDGWKNHTYKVPREDLIISNPKVVASPVQPSAPPATFGGVPKSLLVPKQFTAPKAPPANVTLKRYPVDIPPAPGYSFVKDDTDVQLGMKLNACYAKKWENVTVVAINSDGTITCDWDNWPGFTYKMVREDLTIADQQTGSPILPPSTMPAAPEKQYSLKRYPINIPLAVGYSVVGADTEVKVSRKLGACYAGRWESVTVVAINSDGTITCNWDNYPGFTYKMMREDLTISN